MLGKTVGKDFRQRIFFDEAISLDAEKRTLRELLDSLHTEPETLLEQTLHEPATRRNMGKFIGFAMVKPYSGEDK